MEYFIVRHTHTVEDLYALKTRPDVTSGCGAVADETTWFFRFIPHEDLYLLVVLMGDELKEIDFSDSWVVVHLLIYVLGEWSACSAYTASSPTWF